MFEKTGVGGLMGEGSKDNWARNSKQGEEWMGVWRWLE